MRSQYVAYLTVRFRAPDELHGGAAVPVWRGLPVYIMRREWVAAPHPRLVEGATCISALRSRTAFASIARRYATSARSASPVTLALARAMKMTLSPAPRIS